MKLICSKTNLLNGVQIVSKAVPNKTTMSILECILVDTTKGMITLTANDMEMGIETTIEGEIVEKGIIALDASQSTLSAPFLGKNPEFFLESFCWKQTKIKTMGFFYLLFLFFIGSGIAVQIR